MNAEHRTAGPGRGQPRNLDLPLLDQLDSELWAGEAGEPRDHGVWPALSDSLSERGRQLLWDGMREAIEATPGDPERALMVVEAFWRTMRVRRGPGYERRLAAGPGPSRVYEPGELRGEVEAQVSSA
jgi:hypothetical protein